MLRIVAITIFFVALACIVIGGLSYISGVRLIGIQAFSFVSFANTCLLIVLVCIALDIHKKIK